MSHRPRVKYFQSCGGLAKIEGSAECSGEGINFEMAMTESPTGRVKGILERSISFLDLEDVVYRKPFFKKPSLTFSVRSLETLNSIPYSKGYLYRVTPLGSPQMIRSFVSEVQLAIAQASMERFTSEIENSEI